MLAGKSDLDLSLYLDTDTSQITEDKLNRAVLHRIQEDLMGVSYEVNGKKQVRYSVNLIEANFGLLL